MKRTLLLFSIALSSFSFGQGQWYNYALQLNDPTSGSTPNAAFGSFVNLFPDSTLIEFPVTISGNPDYVRYHKAATIIDPKNMPINPWNISTVYIPDSIAIGYKYERNLAPGIVDTLLIQIIKHDASLEWNLSGATYQDITYASATNSINSSQVIGTYKHLLTTNDVTSVLKELKLKLNNIPSQVGSNRIGAVISFIPGYTYSASEDLNTKNIFSLYSYEQNGEDTDPTFYGTIGTGTSDLNCSYTLDKTIRYNINPNGWNGYLEPLWSKPTGFSYEHHHISFYLKPDSGLGINDINETAEIYPSPATDQVNVLLGEKVSGKINCVIRDNSGRILENLTLEMQDSLIQLNTSNLSTGVYFIELNTQEKTYSGKIIIQ